MKSRALVTGGAGFVGSHVVRALLERSYEVTVIDDLSNGKRDQVPPGVEFIEADLATPDAYEPLGERRFDVVYHIAAQASNAISVREPFRDLHANQLATLHLLEYARRTGSRRVLFTSSMSAYGDAQRFPTPESEPLRPRTPYAVHKAACEQYLRLYAEEHGLEPTVFRLYTTYGGGQNLDNLDQGLLSIFLAYLVRGEPIVVKGSLDRQRDIVHVTDVVSALLAAVDHPQTIGRTYNMCSGVSLSVGEMIRALIQEAGEDPDAYPVHVEGGTPGDPDRTHGSFEQAAKDFGFKPAVTPLEGIRRTVAAQRESAAAAGGAR
jgi:UDP-glucose 4-epimerase